MPLEIIRAISRACKGHAVADEEDDVLGLALSFVLNDGIAGIGRISAIGIGSRRFYRIGTGFGGLT